MSLTRKMLKAMGIEEDKIEQIIEEHAETVNGLKEQIRENQSKADELDRVQKELEDIKSKGGDWEQKYKEVSSEYEKYKTETSAKETLAQKKTAYSALLKEAGVTESVIEAVLKATALDKVDIDAEGNLQNREELTNNIKNEWKGFIVSSNTNGVQTQTPPANNASGGEYTSKADIMKISDRAERLQAIKENPQLFGK